MNMAPVRTKTRPAVLDATLFEALADSSRHGIVILEDGRVTYANPRLAEMVGRPRREVENWTIEDFLGWLQPDDRATARSAYDNPPLQEPVGTRHEFRFVDRKGEARWLEVAGAMVVRSGVTVMQATLIDITDRKAMERALRESEEKYRALIEQSLEGLVIIQENRIVFANRALVEISGYPLEEILALTPEQMWASLEPDDRVMVLSRLQERLAGKPVPSRYAVRVHRKDGSMYWADLSVSLIEYRGQPAIQATYVDVTERIAAEAGLRQSEERYRLLYENLADGVFLTDDKGNIRMCNARGAEIFGFTPNDLLGAHFGKLVHPDDRERLLRGFGAGLHTRRTAPGGLEAKGLRKDGSTFFYHVTSKLLVENGRVRGMQALIRDITERKLAAEKIEEARNRAEFFNDLMAHDLNNINQGILSALELALYNRELPPKPRQQIQLAFDQVMRSADLIGRVKKIARLDVESPLLTAKDIAPTFFSAVEAAKSSMPGKTVKLTTNIKEGAYHVVADEFLGDLFFNLLHNAMKFDRSSQVVIDVKATPDSRKQVVKIEFKDHGPGIPDEAKGRIFARLTSRREQRTRTSGIGLTLARGIVERYNGQISVQDRVAGDPSRGANFVVVLPAERQGSSGRSD